jgi:hypothetical protein
MPVELFCLFVLLLAKGQTALGAPRALVGARLPTFLSSFGF